jgi:hypothetical protein
MARDLSNKSVIAVFNPSPFIFFLLLADYPQGVYFLNFIAKLWLDFVGVELYNKGRGCGLFLDR